MHSTHKQTLYTTSSCVQLGQHLKDTSQRGSPSGGFTWVRNLLHIHPLSVIFSAVILHNFNGFRTNLLRFRPVWMEDSTLLLVLGLPFGQSVVMFVIVANFMNLLVTFFGCTVGFYALTINCVYAMWQPKRKLGTVFGGVCCGLGFVYKLMIKSFDYMRSAKASAVATFQKVHYGTSCFPFPYYLNVVLLRQVEDTIWHANWRAKN